MSGRLLLYRSAAATAGHFAWALGLRRVGRKVVRMPSWQAFLPKLAILRLAPYNDAGDKLRLRQWIQLRN